MEKRIALSLCEGRHEMPSMVGGSIFPQNLNPLDLEGMANIVSQKLEGVKSLELYVTGLTVALVEVIKYCLKERVTLTLYHYDRERGTYYPQKVVEGHWCPEINDYCPCYGQYENCACDKQTQYECGGMGCI